MFRALLRLVLILIVIAAAAAFFMGYRFGDYRNGSTSERPVATTGSGPAIDTTKARQTGAAIGEKVAESANRAEHALGDGALTAKIKSKMALDDSVKSLNIDVDTNAGVVTLSGTVRSQAEKTRALQLARETSGVKSVEDRLVIR
ncbi:MAG TPA: BON domain-containing protein [Vicinamibacterales bacterium]|jgi:hyperosmotically inducible periplasmic protein|nr:BON domain-containing protein [Vicinamibacterales bacterium]